MLKSIPSDKSRSHKILFFIIFDIDLKRRFFKEGKTLFFFYFIYLFYYLITVFKNDIYKFIYLIN